MKHIPLTTLIVCVLSTFIQFVPGIADILQWDRSMIAGGEFWRAITGHLCLWTNSHFIWDLIVFASLGSILEHKNRKLFFAIVLGTPILSHVALLLFSDFEHYRGLSAIDSALFCFAVILVGRYAFAKRNIAMGAVSILGLIGMIGKSVLEILQSSPVFASTLGTGVEVASITHLAGFSTPLAIVVLSSLFKRSTKEL